jgi:hypothetical protein
MKKIRGDEPVEVIIHIYMYIFPYIYMEISQGNSWYSYLYLKEAKMSVFSFYLFSFFSSTKSENRRAEQVLPQGKAGTSDSGEVLGKVG